VSFKVEFQEVFSVEDCEANPNKLYIFGDNLLRKGSGPYSGQAVIRHCKNAHGIATKREPNNMPYAFFSDKQDEFEAVGEDFFALLDKISSYNVVVFPSDGLGTGRANLPNNSPAIFEFIQQWVAYITDYHTDT
jgi:hypothetical protein